MANPVMPNRRFQMNKGAYLVAIVLLVLSAGGAFADDIPKPTVWGEDKPIGVSRGGHETVDEQLERQREKGLLPRQSADKVSADSDD